MYNARIQTLTKAKQMKKYSLKWWFQTGAIYRAQGEYKKRIAKKLAAHLAFKLGYLFGKWNPANEGDFNRIVLARKN